MFHDRLILSGRRGTRRVEVGVVANLVENGYDATLADSALDNQRLQVTAVIRWRDWSALETTAPQRGDTIADERGRVFKVTAVSPLFDGEWTLTAREAAE